MKKEKLFDALIMQIISAKKITMQRQKESQTEANMHIGAMESRYDTFKEEAQYLAGAQAIRVNELNQELLELQQLYELVRQNAIPYNRICLGSLVVVETEFGEKKTYLVASAAGGQLIETEEGKCQVITPASPVGRALVGKKVGDEIEFLLNGTVIISEVIAIE